MRRRHKATPERRRQRATSSTWFPPCLPLLLTSRLRMFDGLGEVAPKRLRPLQPDMQAHGAGIDAEVDRRVGTRCLDAHDLCRDDQAFMPAPAHAEPEELEVVGKG